MRRSILLFAGLAIAALPAVGSAQEVLLRLAPAAGTVTRYQMGMKVWMVGPGSMSSDRNAPMMDFDADMTQTVLSRRGDISELAVLIDSADLSMAAAPGLQMPDLSGLRTLTTVDSRGRLIDARVDQQNSPARLRGVGNQFSQMIGTTSLELPEQPVSPGYSWNASYDQDVGGMGQPIVMRFDNTYRFERLETRGGGRVAVIAMQGTVTQSSDTRGGSSGGMSMEMDGTSEGRFLIDLDSGIIATMENDVRMEGSMNINGNSIPVTVTTEVRLQSR